MHVQPVRSSIAFDVGSADAFNVENTIANINVMTFMLPPFFYIQKMCNIETNTQTRYKEPLDNELDSLVRVTTICLKRLFQIGQMAAGDGTKYAFSYV